MSETTIQIPAEHLQSIHRSLVDRQQTLAEGGGDPPADAIAAVEALIAQVEAERGAPPSGLEVTGAREVLWNAVYDAFCAAVEAFADKCNDFWQTEGGSERLRAEIASLGSGLDLLDELGPPPRD